MTENPNMVAVPVTDGEWFRLVEHLPTPWPRAVAVVDLRWHTATGRTLDKWDAAQRWGWDAEKALRLLARWRSGDFQ